MPFSVSDLELKKRLSLCHDFVFVAANSFFPMKRVISLIRLFSSPSSELV